MIVRLLGFIDLFGAAIALLLMFGVNIPLNLVILAMILLFLKAFFPSFCMASLIDITAALLLLIIYFFTIPKIIIIGIAFLMLQKAFLSFV
jgi:hypothetical protein